MSKEIRQTLIDSIKRNNETGKVGICLSGGIDSSCVLEALIASGIKPTAYVARFGEKGDQVEQAREVARYFKIPIIPVDIVNFIEILPVILKHFPTPQYNLWTWLIFDRAHRDGVSSMYVGEGSDEIFGYDTRSYLHGWTGQLAFVWPAWLNSAKAFDIHLRAPFMSLEPSLDFRKGLPPNTQYFDPFEKKLLRDQYKDILPSFVLNRPSIPPSGPFYALVARELKMVGADLDAIKIALQKEAAKAWLEAHK